MDTCHKQISGPFLLWLLLDPQRCRQHHSRTPQEEFRELPWRSSGVVGPPWDKMEKGSQHPPGSGSFLPQDMQGELRAVPQ